MHIETPQNRTTESPSTTELLLFGVLSLLMVVWLNIDLIHMPPVWDAAPGVFAPAIYLYETGFDFSALLSEPGYLAGGSNVHTLSLVTLLTAFVYWLTEGSVDTFPILHAMQFVFTAVALTAAYRLARLSCGRITSGLLALSVLVLPVFRVQTGALYTEILGAALVLLTLVAWVRHKHLLAILFVTLACADKSLGLPIVGALAALLVIDASLTLSMRVRYVAVLSLLVGILEYSKWLLRPMDATSIQGSLSSMEALLYRLEMVPDLFALICIALLWMLLFSIGLGKRDAGFLHELCATTRRGERERLSIGLALFVGAFLLFFLLAVQHAKLFIPLVRYYVWILPLLMLILLEAMPVIISRASSILNKRPDARFNADARNVVLIMLIALGVYNSDGKIYPNIDGVRKFSVAERSLEYLNYYDVQRYGVESVGRNDRGSPVFVTRGEYYYLSSPLMGFVSTRVKDLRFILQPPYSAWSLKDFPAEFMLLDSFSGGFHGQSNLINVLREARRNDRYEVVTVDSHTNGTYRTKLYRIGLKQKPFE